jgi:hypothetical protein
MPPFLLTDSYRLEGLGADSEVVIELDDINTRSQSGEQQVVEHAIDLSRRPVCGLSNAGRSMDRVYAFWIGRASTATNMNIIKSIGGLCLVAGAIEEYVDFQKLAEQFCVKSLKC